MKQKRGVTLVEIAIVLVIIGLLLGGVLKGQELINNAKVRSIADRQSSLKVAWFSFIDRYQALPGDYVHASANIPGAAPRANYNPGDGIIEVNESPIVFQNLTGAGYLRCPQCTADDDDPPTALNSLQNQYGGVMGIFHDSTYYAAVGGPGGRARLYIHTGPQIPSNIISEVDRKIDDGIANTGDLVFNDWANAVNPVPDDGECMAQGQAGDIADSTGGDKDDVDENFWRGALAQPPVEQNCQGSVAI